MIAHLSGTVARKGSDFVVVDVQGVGYLVSVPIGSAMHMPGEGDPIFLHTTMVVREDDISLYGFATPFDLDVFQMAMSVAGVGPRAALGLLGALGAEELARAAASGDVRTIMRAPGIGQKLAQRIVLELGEKMGRLALERRVEAAGAGPAVSERADVYDDVVEALVSLGYGRADSRRAAEQVLSGAEPETETVALVRKALQVLSGEGRRRA